MRLFLVSSQQFLLTRRYPYVPLLNLRHHPNPLPPGTSNLEDPRLSGLLPVLRTFLSPFVVNYLTADGVPSTPIASSSFD